MRILWLKSDLLLPLDKGGRLRTWHLMRHLAKRHAITYLAFSEAHQAATDVARMREVCTDVIAIPRSDPPKGSWRFYADAARHLADPLPYAVGKYRSRAYARRLRGLLDERTFDLIVCDFLFPAVNLPKALPCPAVMFTHNVESEIWRRHAETKTSTLGRFLYGMQYRRMLRYEHRALARFDGVLAVSEADSQTFRRLYPDAIRQPVHIVPTGVDTEYFTPRDDTRLKPYATDESPAIDESPVAQDFSPAPSRSLVFTGSMDWLPNEDAMLFFCRETLPLIRLEEPDVTLSIVGRAPTPAVTALARQHGVIVTGRVEDVRPYMRDAAVYVVPLRIGGGTRLKIFEAMAMAKAVVSTGVGAEGLPVTHGEHVWLADEPQTFARAVVSLLRDVDRRRHLEEAARTLVLERYDWSAVAGQLEQALIQFSQANTEDVCHRGTEARSLPAFDAVGLRSRPALPVSVAQFVRELSGLLSAKRRVP
jgi:polysaccharide biosynthesis protein PslH